MHHLANGLDHEVRLLDRHIMSAAVGDDEASAGDGLDPGPVRLRLGVDFWPQVRPELPDGAACERHFAGADGINQDERCTSFEGGCIVRRMTSTIPCTSSGYIAA
jgi:hypothetical protein